MADTDLKALREAAESKEEAAQATATQTGYGATTGKPVGGQWTPQLVSRLSLGIGTFGILALGLVAVLILRRRSAEQVLRTFGILLIILSAVFLVIAGYSDTQITPVIGLLGTIAGYLLGRRIEPTGDEQPATSPRPRSPDAEKSKQAPPSTPLPQDGGSTSPHPKPAPPPAGAAAVGPPALG